MCVAHIFSWLQLCNHPFLTATAQLFFLITEKVSLSIPQTQLLFLKWCHPHKAVCYFCNAIAPGHTKKYNYIAQFLWWTPIALQTEIHVAHKSDNIHGENASKGTPFKRCHQTRSGFWWFTCSTTPLWCQGKVPWPSDHPTATSFSKILIFIWIHWVHKSPNFDEMGWKAEPFLTLPSLVSPSFHLHLRYEAGSVFCHQQQGKFNVLCMLWLKNVTKYSPLCAFFPDAGTNIQQSTGQEGEIKPTWERSSLTKSVDGSNWLHDEGFQTFCIKPEYMLLIQYIIKKWVNVEERIDVVDLNECLESGEIKVIMIKNKTHFSLFRLCVNIRLRYFCKKYQYYCKFDWLNNPFGFFQSTVFENKNRH